MRKKKSFLICPVKDANRKQLSIIARIVKYLEMKGFEVHWPYRDTIQVYHIYKYCQGLRISRINIKISLIY